MNVVDGEEAFIAEEYCRVFGGSLVEKSRGNDGEEVLRKGKEAAVVVVVPVVVVSLWSDGREKRQVPNPAAIAIVL